MLGIIIEWMNSCAVAEGNLFFRWNPSFGDIALGPEVSHLASVISHPMPHTSVTDVASLLQCNAL